MNYVSTSPSKRRRVDVPDAIPVIPDPGPNVDVANPTVAPASPDLSLGSKTVKQTLHTHTFEFENTIPNCILV
jgi:hypothetical protein